ncbi:MAG: SdiA-regulated domain-containing protein, partial [Luteolibacter sp.]
MKLPPFFTFSLVALAAFSSTLNGQTTLAAGDIAFVGFNADGNDNLAFVALADIAAGEAIIFEDNEWNGTGWADTNEGAFIWTASSMVTAGTIVTLDSVGIASPSLPTASTGTIAYAPAATHGSNRGIGGGDETIFAYQGTRSAPTFIAAVTSGGFTAANGLLAGTGLTAGVNALELNLRDDDGDIFAWVGSRAGYADFAAVRAAANASPTVGNWNAQDASGDQSVDGIVPDVPFSVAPFTVGSTVITLVTSATTTSFSESTSNPASIGTVTRDGSTATSLLVNLSSNDATEATVPATVTIPINQTSVNFDITAVDDSFPDGSKTPVITASAVGATNGILNLTVTDDGDVITSNLMLTEILSNQTAGNTVVDEDYWELTNFGSGSVDLTGYSWNDSARTRGVAFPSGTTINAGESVIFTATEPTAFRTWWNLPGTVKVIQTATAPGLGSGDGVSFFDSTGNELFFFNYAANGFTREDGSLSTGGHAGPSAGAALDQIAMIWVPTSPTSVTTGTAGPTPPRYTFATGNNYGSKVAATNADLGSPGNTVGVSSVSIANAAAAEGDSGTSTLALDVTRTDLAAAFSVDYAVTGGSADGADYTLAAGNLNFPASGAASLPINITVNGDTATEPDETLIVTLSNIVNTTGTTVISTAVGTGTITNDDLVPPTITTQPASTTLTTGKATTLVVAATGTPAPTIQWYQGNSGDTSNPVSGATSAIFLTPTLTTNTNFWARATSGATTLDSATATVTIVPGVTSVDLATYIRAGRHNLPHPSRDPAPANNLLAEEASGVAYNWDTDTLFIIGDGGRSVTQVLKNGTLVNTMTLALNAGKARGVEFDDPEGITYIGGGEFVLSEERDRQAVKFTYAPGTTLIRSATQTVKLGTSIGNTGLEGLCYDPQTSGFIFTKESGPIGIFQTTIDFALGTASNGSPSTVNSTDLFDPTLASTLDMSDVFAFSNIPSMTSQPQAGDLLIISQESAKIVNINRAGAVSSSLTLVSDPGNITIQDQTHEGIVMDPTGLLYVVSENGGGTSAFPQVWVFQTTNAVNQPPTAVALSNTVPSLPDNTNTTSAVKVADIGVTDDGLGTNTLSLTGTDASFFEITGNALFLKAGTTLSFLTKPSYSLTVQVDDTNVGNTPDATVNYNLAITAAPVGVANLIISEVAPWSSGNSTVASDWFEVTNIGTVAADITGWKMDDSGGS